MWGGLVVGAAFLVYIPVAGFVNSFGVFVERFDEAFCRPDDCLEILGLISALALANFRLLTWFSVSLEALVPNAILFLIGFMLCTVSMFTTALVKGIYSLLLTHSVLYGFGSTLMLNTPMSLIESYFPKTHARHVLATSIVNLGPPIGVIIMNPLAVYLDKHEVHDWRDTMRVFGTAIVVMGLIYVIVTYLAQMGSANNMKDTSDYQDLEPVSEKTAPSEKNCGGHMWTYLTRRVQPTEEMSLFGEAHIWCTCRTIMWIFAIFLVSVALFIPKTHFIRFMTNLGLTEERSAMVMSFSGISEAATSFLIAFTGDLMGIHIVAVYMLGSLALCVGNILLIFAYTEGQCAIYVVIHGAVDGLLMTVLFSVVSHVGYHERHTMALWAVSNFAIGMGQIAGLPVAGVLYDSFHSYGPAFMMSSCVFGGAAILFALIYCSVYRQLPQDEEKLAIIQTEDESPVESKDS